jgi:CHAD domain-containing protein
MAFQFDPTLKVRDEYRRVVGEQFDGAVAGLSGATPDTLGAAVHDARKRCKRLRATFRLVRPALGERRFRSLDVSVRDAARELSTSRDAAALLDMFDALLAAHGVDRAAAGFRAARGGFETRLASLSTGEADPDARPVHRALEQLRAAAGLAQQSELDASGFAALQPGLAATYGQGASALDRLRRTGSIEASHDWRKAVKYTWHHLELLEATAPSVLDPAARAFHQVADALGDAHNLAVLVETVQTSPPSFGGPEVIGPLCEMAEQSRADLEDRAITLGVRLYAETPRAFANRLRGYWSAARKIGPERPTGELSDVTPGPPPANAEARNLSLIS